MSIAPRHHSTFFTGFESRVNGSRTIEKNRLIYCNASGEKWYSTKSRHSNSFYEILGVARVMLEVLCISLSYLEFLVFPCPCLDPRPRNMSFTRSCRCISEKFIYRPGCQNSVIRIKHLSSGIRLRSQDFIRCLDIIWNDFLSFLCCFAIICFWRLFVFVMLCECLAKSKTIHPNARTIQDHPTENSYISYT